MAFKEAWVFAYSMKICGTPAVSFRHQSAIVKITDLYGAFLGKEEKSMRFKRSSLKNKFIPPS